MPKPPAGRLPRLYGTTTAPSGPLPAVGSRRFELGRERLAVLSKREREQIAVPDVIEFLTREQRGLPLLE